MQQQNDTKDVRPKGFKLNSKTGQWEPQTAINFLEWFSEWSCRWHSDQEDALRWARRDMKALLLLPT